MTYLLDTMVWLWLANSPGHVPQTIRAVLEEDPDRWGLSAVSVWEVARKARLAARKPRHPAALDLKIPFREWSARALDPEDFLLLPLTPDISAEANSLPGVFHDDPMDQIIVATARIHDLVLVTSDQKIKQYKHVKKLFFRGPSPQL